MFKRIRRRTPAVLLVLSMMASMIVPASAVEAGGTGLSEMPAHWASAELNDWVAKGWLRGDESGNLNPDATITRAQFMAFANRMMGYTEQSAAIDGYSDVPRDAWYYQDAAVALAAGYMQGAEGRMRPDDAITRNEAVIIVARLAGLETGTADEAVLASVSDGAEVPAWARAALASAVAEGLMAGYAGAFRGTLNVSRAETVVMLGRIASGNRVFGFAGTYGGEVSGDVTVASGGVILKEMKISGNLTISSAVAGGGRVELIGTFGNVISNAAGVALHLTGSVALLALNAPATVTGGGEIGRAEVAAEAGKGTSFATAPKELAGEGKGGVTLPAAGGGGGGGSTGGNPGPVTPSVATAQKEAEKYRTAITLSPATKLGDNITHQAVSLASGQTADSTFSLTVAEKHDPGNYLSVSGNQATLTGLAMGSANTAKLTLTVAKGSDRASVTVTVTVPQGGWQTAQNADSRFAAGYPKVVVENGRYAVKVRLTGASASNPIEVFGIYKSSEDGGTTSEDVLHGHAGWDGNYSYADACFSAIVTDSGEHTVDTGIDPWLEDYMDMSVALVLQDSGTTSVSPTIISYRPPMLETNITYAMNAYLNQARTVITLRYSSKLALSSVPAPSAFTLGGISGSPSVTAVELKRVVEEESWGITNVILSVSGIDMASDLSELSVTYTKPTSGPALQILPGDSIQDPIVTRKIPVKSAAVQIVPGSVCLSADRRHVSFALTNHFDYSRADLAEILSIGYVDTTSSLIPLEYSQTDVLYYYSDDYRLYLILSQPLPSGKTLEVSLTGIKDFAGDAVDTTGWYDSASSITGYNASAAILFATYVTELDESAWLRIDLAGRTLGNSLPGCSFTLFVNGIPYRLRTTFTPRQTAYGQYYLKAPLDQLPIPIQSGDLLQLSYAPAHDDYAFTLTSLLWDLAGAPVAATNLPVKNTRTVVPNYAYIEAISVIQPSDIGSPRLVMARIVTGHGAEVCFLEDDDAVDGNGSSLKEAVEAIYASGGSPDYTPLLGLYSFSPTAAGLVVPAQKVGISAAVSYTAGSSEIQVGGAATYLVDEATTVVFYLPSDDSDPVFFESYTGRLRIPSFSADAESCFFVLGAGEALEFIFVLNRPTP